ncbi:MAG: endolytic transglycosylase MltG [Cytophagales bacterium]|nr:endolytic transglycosylase MltG [Cytophagales bacterium]
MRKRKLLAVFLIVFTVLLSSFSFYGYQMLYTPNINIDAEDDIVFSIDRGATFKQLQNKLYDTRVVNELVTFSFLAKVMGYDDNVQPGHYTLTPDMTNLETIRFFRQGNPPVKVQFQNVRTIDNLASVFSKYLAMDSAQWSQYFGEENIHSEIGFNRENMISLFLPNTYEFYYKVNPDDLMNRMKETYDKFWTEERLQKAENIGLTPQEVSTLASIVRGETAKMDEASTIAGVYYNRLKKGMRLQADPTLIFAQQDYSIRRVRKGDREIDSPYNTYKYKGLPPGPIYMPTKAYIDAVLNVEDHEYVFFCAKADFSGYHIFAKNFDTHLKNARKFQRALNERGIER